MSAEVLPLYKGMEVQEVEVNKIRSKFRLRTPNDEKIHEIAGSIKLCGLINPVTIDANFYLLAGYHRWKAFELLGYTHIPAVIHDEDKLRGELVEVEENLSRNELNAIEESEHLGRREEILEELGMLMPFGGNQYSNGKVTVKERAEGIGMKIRMYQLKKQILNIEEEVRDLQRDMRDLQRELRNADNDDEVADIEARLDPLQAQIDAEMDTLETQTTAYQSLMQEYQQEQNQQEANRNAAAQNLIIATLCDFGNTLRSLQNDEHVTVVMQNFNDNLDQVYVFDYADVAGCSSAEELLEDAIAYQL